MTTAITESEKNADAAKISGRRLDIFTDTVIY